MIISDQRYLYHSRCIHTIDSHYNSYDALHDTIITLILSLSSFSALLQNYVDHTTATSWLFLRVALLPTETFLATALQSQC